MTLDLPVRALLSALLFAFNSACGDAPRAMQSAGELDERPATALDVIDGTSDDDLRAAAAALRAGLPWEATRRLHPLVRGERAATASPAVAIVAAEAAAAWGGWDEAARVLAAAPWRGTGHAGEGHELLARIALQRNDAAAAAAQADSALRAPADAMTRGIRMTLLARALDRAVQRDSAAAAYHRAATMVPAAADWLRLRAAGVTTDASARARLYEAVRTPVARTRIPWTEALALEQAGDAGGAVRLYDSLRARPQALRLQLIRATDSATRAALREKAIAVLELPRSFDEWRRTEDLLDSSFAKLSTADELRVARGAARHGTAARAVASYSRAADAGATLTDQDRYDYANALARVGRWRDAATQYGRVAAASSLAGRAAYQRARALLRAGQGTQARRALRDVVRRQGSDATAASSALYLLADLATDDGRDAAARSAWREIVTRYPRSARASDAAFRAAMIAYVDGNLRTAAREWEAGARAWPNGSESIASHYWAGRAWARLRDTTAAHAQWREVMRRSPTSYYAVMAARRLDVAPWRPARAADTPPANAMVDSSITRMRMLDSLGMDVEVGHERTALLARVEGEASALLAAGAAFRAMGQSSRAIALGLRAEEEGARDARTYRLIYPILHREALVAAAKRMNLDPALVAALVRQESSFNPRAVSPVGARGLMQLMPNVGRAIARSRNYPLWDDDLLFQPTVSFDLGTAHLAGDLRKHRDLARALAAYNAGASRVTRWAQKRGVSDPEVFAERIPYVETRDYVRIVQRNVEMYRALYDWK